MQNLNMPRRSLLAAVVALAFTSEGLAADLTGTWCLNCDAVPPSTFFEITQTGNDVALTTLYAPYNFVGTLTADQLLVDSTNYPVGYGTRISTSLLDNGNVMDGATITFSYPPIPTPPYRFFATRCECFDGNGDPGDGCDAQCRVEPCFECTGAPSVCTPAGDGAACDDRRDCTSGETCNAGTCAGGSAVADCIDMTGRWKLELTEDSARSPYAIEDFRDVVQRNGFLMFHEISDGALGQVGSVDWESDTISLFTGQSNGPSSFDPYTGESWGWATSCGRLLFTGTAAADGSSFTGNGSGWLYVPGFGRILPSCSQPTTYTQHATRCGPGECLIAPNECRACYARNEAGVCEPGPHAGCRSSLEPTRNSLRILDNADDAKDQLVWMWKSGEAASSISLGDPVGHSTDVAVCVFDESGPAPQLVYRTIVDGNPEEWKQTNSGGFTFRSDGFWSGIRKMELRPGEDGQSSASVKGKGVALMNEEFAPPSAPLGLPLRVQTQTSRGGACFESVYDADGVRRNEDGYFKAKASQ